MTFGENVVTVHLKKLSVGSDSLDTLRSWQALRLAKTGSLIHITRNRPRRAEEILGGGSIYWIIKGFLQCRQRILRLDEVIGSDGIRRCAIVLDPEVIRTTSAKKRPFQGWRYLTVDDAPVDLAAQRENEDQLPPELANALADIGVV